MNNEFLNILQSPDDGTPILPNFSSEGGIKYEITESGVLILDHQVRKRSDVVYNSPMFLKWNQMVAERVQYYTGRETLAGRLAGLGHRNLSQLFEDRTRKWILDIGCGDGAQLESIRNKYGYIGLDRNMKRLEILKKKYPEVIAIYGDAGNLPFKTGKISHVYSSFAFEHIWYLKDAMLEIHRCLMNEGKALIVIPTEGGLWNLGRRLVSQPHFTRKYPELDFNFISHAEHCNQANQVIRTFEMLFEVRRRYWPTQIPTMFLNAFVELQCTKSSRVAI